MLCPKAQPLSRSSLSVLGWEMAHGLKNGHFHSDEVAFCAPTRCVSPHPSPAGPLCDFLLTNQLSLCSFDVVMKSLYSERDVRRSLLPQGNLCSMPPCLLHCAWLTSQLTEHLAGASGLCASLLTLSLCFCLRVWRRAVRAALRAQWPPQLQLPCIIQSQLSAGQPRGECTAPLLPHFSVLQKEASTPKA